jgi:hypothetical protein
MRDPATHGSMLNLHRHAFIVDRDSQTADDSAPIHVIENENAQGPK